MKKSVKIKKVALDPNPIEHYSYIQESNSIFLKLQKLYIFLL